MQGDDVTHYKGLQWHIFWIKETPQNQNGTALIHAHVYKLGSSMKEEEAPDMIIPATERSIKRPSTPGPVTDNKESTSNDTATV